MTSIAVNFEFDGERDPELPYAYLPAMPRVGDKIRKDKPNSKTYIVKDVLFEVPSQEDGRASLLVLLEAGK